MHLLLLTHLFGRFVIDIMHGFVGECFLAGFLQQLLHQQLLAVKGELAFKLQRVAHLLRFGRLRHQNHVGHELDQVVLLGVRRHWRQLTGLLLGDGEVALMDLGTVDLGHHRVDIISARGATRQY